MSSLTKSCKKHINSGQVMPIVRQKKGRFIQPTFFEQLAMFYTKLFNFAIY